MASVAGFFFQSLNKSLVQVLLQKLGTRFLKYVNADLEKAAVGGLMDHVCLENVTLNLSQINSDLVFHHIPLQLTSGSIAKVEINLYLAHSQLHIILSGLHVLALPSLPSSLADAPCSPSSSPSQQPGAASRSAPSSSFRTSADASGHSPTPFSTTHAERPGGPAAPAAATFVPESEADSVSREIYDNQVEKIRTHIRVCTTRLFQEAVRKHLERLQRLARQLRMQWREKQALGASDEVLSAAIDRHGEEAKKLQAYLQAVAQEEAEGQPFLQWLLRYMPNIKIRFNDVHVHYDDARGVLSHPVRCGVKISRLLLQPQQGAWRFFWPTDEKATGTKSAENAQRENAPAKTGETSNVFLDFPEGERDSAGVAPPTGETSSTNGGSASGASASGAKDLIYGISIEGFGIYWEDACGTAAATAAGVAARAPIPAPTPGTVFPGLDSSSLVRSPQELAEVLSSLSSAGSAAASKVSLSGSSRRPVPARPLPGGSGASVADEKAGSASGRQSEDACPAAAATAEIFFRRWLLKPVSFQAQLGLHNASPQSAAAAGGLDVAGGASAAGDPRAGPPARGAATALGSGPRGPEPNAVAASRQVNLKLLGRIEEAGVEVEVDEGMVMGVSVFLERVRHQRRLRDVRLYRPHKRPRGGWRPEREAGEMHASHCMRGSEAKEGTCKLWWAYAFQFVKLLRRERPATGKEPRGARSTQYWGRMEERTAHMKRYMRIAKRYMLEQRMQRLLNSGASGAAAPHPVSSFTDSDASPSALPFALTSPPSSLLSLSSPFLGCVSSSLSSTAASSSGLPYTTSEENLADFFSHFWTKRQAQLRRQETRGPERGSSQGPPDVTRSLFQGDAACGVLRMGARPAQAPFAFGDEDSDASFIVGIVERRPYWAVAQWHMLAAAELEAAEKALLKTRSAASQKDDQKTVARLLASLDQEQRRLILTQQKRLLASHMPTDDVSSVSALAQVQLQESEQTQAVRRMQEKVQELLQPLQEAVLNYFDTPSSFVKLAREAVQKLLELRKVEDGPDRESVKRMQDAAETYRATARQLHESRAWSLSRERMLCWAEFYRMYTTAFPLTDCVLVDMNELQQLAQQQQDSVLSLAESSRLPVKRAERRAPLEPKKESTGTPPRRAPP
ncbi:hypothetical protein TGDOM2_211150A, partial [Toxoplasma gondii GAB2-2007-GAL-DOM2]